jgi:hypothetical protein
MASIWEGLQKIWAKSWYKSLLEKPDIQENVTQAGDLVKAAGVGPRDTNSWYTFAINSDFQVGIKPSEYHLDPFYHTHGGSGTW